MKEIIPFIDMKTAKAELDNGGRFYNWLTDANDGEVELSELARFAGVFSDKQKMFLYLELALSNLDDAQRQEVLNLLSDDLKALKVQFQPVHYSPALALQNGSAGEAAVIRGIPRHVEAKTQFSGFVMIPIVAGNVTTFSMIPIIDRYDVYEVYDCDHEQTFIVAHAKNKAKFEFRETLIAGVMKEFKNTKDERQENLFLEACYFCDAK